MFLNGLHSASFALFLAFTIWMPQLINTPYKVTAIVLEVFMFLTMVISKMALSAPKKPKVGPYGEVPGENWNGSVENQASESEDEQVLDEFINRIVEHCMNKGKNVTLQNKTDGIWLVEVDDTQGMVRDILNLTKANNGIKLSRENLKKTINNVIITIDNIFNSNVNK